MSVYTANEIISLARQIASIPNTSSTGSRDADLLLLANHYLQTTLAPAILASREDFFTVPVRTAISSATSRVRIHQRAMFQKVRSVRHVLSDETFNYLQYIDGADVDEFGIDLDANGDPRYVWVEGAHLRFAPRPTQGSIEQLVPFRPGKLVLTSDARQVQSVSGSTITLTSAVPSGWVDGSIFDVHSPYSGGEIKAFDRASTSVIGSTITFSSDLDGSLTGETAVEAGDWVVLQETAAVPACPSEFHAILAHAVATKYTEMNDPEMWKVHNQLLQEQMRVALSQIEPRIDGKPRKIRGTPYIGAQGAWFRL